MAAKAQKEDVKFEDKQKALDAALSQIEKQFGKGAVMKLGDNNAKMAVEVVPTGSLSLDLALGVGGLPKGRIVEVYGPESSGKTTVAEARRHCRVCGCGACDGPHLCKGTGG